MLRFRLNELIGERNEGRPPEERISMEDVALAVGVSRSTLAGLTRWERRLPVTNTALMEALCRFFRRMPNDLLEFEPAIDVEYFVNVDELYRQRAIRRRIDRDDEGA